MTLERHRPGRRGWVLLGVLLVLVAVVAWGAVEARRVASGLQAADEGQERARAAVADGDVERARAAVADVAAGTRQAAGAAHSLPLRLAAVLPWVGDDVRAVRDVAVGLDRFSRDVLPPLVDATERLQPDRLVVDGRVDVGALEAERSAVRAAADAADVVARDVGAVRTEGLVDSLRPRVEDVQQALDEAASTLGTTAAAVDVVPVMLGSEGPRTYVVAVQNLAEARPTGGIFGAWAHLRAEDGRLTLVGTGADDDLEALAAAPAAVVPEAAALYGPDLALLPNVNLTPDFPQAALLLSSAWEQQGHPAPDGVLAVDPVLLETLLDATGAVTVADGTTVDAVGAVDHLLHDVYVDIGGDSDERRDYLGEVTAAVFTALTTDGPALAEVASSLREPDVREHLLVWSRHGPEQSLLERTGVAGALPEPDEDTIGVFVTNADGSKLDYWLSGSVVTGRCGDVGLHAVVNLTNGAPERVPTYMGNQLGVTGAALQDLAPGSVTDRTTHRLVVSLLLPPARGVQGLRADGVATGFAAGTERGWTVLRASVDVPAGRTVQLDWSLSGRTDPPDRVLTQPMLNPLDVELYAEVDACGPT
ncbi:DUF4012 domain-containing protein [Thalassiella azotivora]